MQVSGEKVLIIAEDAIRLLATIHTNSKHFKENYKLQQHVNSNKVSSHMYGELLCLCISFTRPYNLILIHLFIKNWGGRRQSLVLQFPSTHLVLVDLSILLLLKLVQTSNCVNNSLRTRVSKS